MRAGGAARGRVRPAGIALLGLGLGWTTLLAQEDGSPPPGFVLGSADAPVTVVEYGDFACSACAQFAHGAWPAVRERYVETGRVLWRMVPFDIGFRNSEEGAKAAYCAADQDAFWAMHDALFLRRDDWVDRRNPKDALLALAEDVGIEGGRFEACYEGDDAEDRIDAANREAKDAGIRGTPTFIVDGVPVQGALPEAAFIQILERSLAGAGKTPGPHR